MSCKNPKNKSAERASSKGTPVSVVDPIAIESATESIADPAEDSATSEQVATAAKSAEVFVASEPVASASEPSAENAEVAVEIVTPVADAPENAPEVVDPERAERKKRDYYNRWVVMALRVLVGAVFVFSGFSKLVDPWGFVFKLEDYLAAMDLDWPRTIALVGAIGISSFELIAGFFLATGCYKRLAPWSMTAMMAVMLPLTLWVWIADPVSDCGCFGEALLISNAATFWKNVALTLALIYLSIYNRRLNLALYRPAIQWIAVTLLAIYCLIISLFGYNVQPMLDFRPFPVGTNLAEVLDGNGDSEVEMEFVYEKDGVQETFTVDNLPDSSWTFVERRAVESESADDTDFAIFDVDDEEVTTDVITGEGLELILVIPEADRADISYSYTANEFSKAVEREGGTMIGLMAASPETLDEWIDLSMADYPYYIADDTSLKQLSRGIMSFVCLKDGIVVWKRTLSSFDYDEIDSIGDGRMNVSDLEFEDGDMLREITLVFLVLLLILALFQRIILAIWDTLKGLFSSNKTAKPVPAKGVATVPSAKVEATAVSTEVEVTADSTEVEPTDVPDKVESPASSTVDVSTVSDEVAAPADSSQDSTADNEPPTESTAPQQSR